ARPAGTRARPARFDAEPEGRHGDVQRLARRARDEGRQDRVPRRQAGERPRADRQGVVQPRGARDQLHGVHGPDRSVQAGGVEGRVRQERFGVQHDGPRRHDRFNALPGLGTMNRTEKEQLVSELKEKLEGATALYYTDFTGLNVKRMTDLRRRLRKANVEYVVIKNTLALRAVNERGLVGERLKGPTGLVVAKDPVAAAKVITDFAKENDKKPTVKGGVFEGKKIDVAQVTKLASMPSREQMLADLGAGLQSPMAAFVGALNGLLYMFAGALDALRTQKEGASA